MRKWMLLFAIVFVFSVLSDTGQTQIKKTLEQRVAALEEKVARLESRFAAQQQPRTGVDDLYYVDEYGIKHPAVSEQEIVLAKQQRYERLQTSEINRRRLVEWRKNRIEEKRQEKINKAYTRSYPAMTCWTWWGF